ncbi:MAG: DUF1289 domain-containing protein [Pseudomonadota bacterium]|nr:DUF1289 domain-containing protein [Pseudomonadota bacterium]
MNHTAGLIAERARQVRSPAAPGAGLPSPCVSVCRMDASSGLCEGCLRTIDEIATWGMLDDAGKRAVWLKIEQRAAG